MTARIKCTSCMAESYYDENTKIYCGNCFANGEKAIAFIRIQILKNGCQWEASKQDTDGDCGHGYRWTCDECPINWQSDGMNQAERRVK